MAEVLFGDVNPGGKLPITIPRSVGHVPAYYNYKPVGAPRLFVRRRVAALSVWLWSELHHVRVRPAAVGKVDDRHATNRRACWSTSRTRARAPATKSCRCTFATW